MGKIFAAFLLAWLVFFMVLGVYCVRAETTPAFNMCECMSKVEEFYNIEGKEARKMCHEALVTHLLEESKKANEILVAAIIGCEPKE